MKAFSRFCLLLALAATTLWTSCKVERVTKIDEPMKDITGTWVVTKATRNGTDLFPIIDTSVISFNNFKIEFKSGSYTLVNRLPFIVSADGTYSLDDPQRPFEITFTPKSGTAIKTAFNYPIVNGVRVLTLSFSPGCPNNTYIYSLKKIN